MGSEVSPRRTASASHGWISSASATVAKEEKVLVNEPSDDEVAVGEGGFDAEVVGRTKWTFRCAAHSITSHH